MLHRIVSTLIVALLLAGMASLGPVPTAAAQDDSRAVRELLERRDREIKALLGDRDTFTEAQREQLKDVINDGIDFQSMARGALGPFWGQITPEQQREFVDVFSAIVRNQSLSNLNVYRATVTYKSVDVNGDSAYVLTSTLYKDVPTDVAYVLGRSGGEWRVRDIIIDDVSTVEGYARSFQSVIRKRGFDALMQSLYKKLDQTKS